MRICKCGNLIERHQANNTLHRCSDCSHIFCWVCGLETSHWFHRKTSLKGKMLLCYFSEAIILTCYKTNFVIRLFTAIILMCFFPIICFLILVVLLWIAQSKYVKPNLFLLLKCFTGFIFFFTSIVAAAFGIIFIIPLILFLYFRILLGICCNSKRILYG